MEIIQPYNGKLLNSFSQKIGTGEHFKRNNRLPLLQSYDMTFTIDTDN